MNKRIYGMLALLSCVTAVGAAQAKELSIYISADMEGIAGVVSEQQLGPEGFEYEHFQVMCRDSLKANAETKARAVHALLDGLGVTTNFAGSGRTYFSIHSEGPPFGLGQDESSPPRWRFVGNYVARKHRG